MIVQNISKKGNNILVVFDDNSSILLNYNVFIDSMLRRNDDVDQKFIDELKRKNELHKIKYSALNLLGRRAHSKRELFQKLSKKKFDKDLCSYVLEELSNLNLINDFDFALKYAEEKIKRGKCGINKVKSELIRKGIDKNTLQYIEQNYSESDEVVDNIKSLALKKLEYLNKKETEKRKIKGKLYSFLQSKGFTSEQIVDVLNKLDI